jgi:hypothetical protein
MGNYLITENQYQKLVDLLKKKYTVGEVSLNKGEVKRIKIVKGISSYGLSLEKFDSSYTLKFYNQNTRVYFIYAGLALLFGITIIVPVAIIILAAYQYSRDKEFKKELELQVEQIIKA